MTTRRAACSCGQLHLTIEGEPSRISMCHCLACQRRTGAVISNQARFRREQVTFAGKATAWMRTAESGNALTFHFCPTCGSTVYWENEGFPGTSPLPSATSPTRISPRRPSRCGRSHATPGSPCRPTRRPSAWRSRGDRHSAGFTGCRSAFVRFGSKADILRCGSDVRFTPKSGHSRLRLACPLCANSGHQPHICSNENRKTASQRSLRKFHHAY